MRELGVGLVYWTMLDPLLGPGGPPISVVELEPQTLWEVAADATGWHYSGNEALLERVVSLHTAKLLHGVGQPVGGTVSDPLRYMPLLNHTVQRLEPEWVSEHLSFNRVLRDGEVEHAGFLLPPPQSPAAVRVAAHYIDRFRRAINRPVAFETGVNYLRRCPGEMDDGDFFSAVAQASGGGIVLDLHNLWCNERNGRQNVADTLRQLPLDRVWELHLAGGVAESGYWLDAHSGAVPPEVMDIAGRLIPDLPDLGAVIFELLPEHLPRIGLDGVQRQIEELQRLWDMRPPKVIRLPDSPPTLASNARPTHVDLAEVAAWETGLVDALRTKPRLPATPLKLREDPGCTLLGKLVRDFRSASLAKALRYTLTALLAGLGSQDTYSLLVAYFEAHPPEPYAAIEADRFARFLGGNLPLPQVPFLDEVLAFEHALLKAMIYGMSSDVAWSADPVRLLEALDAGKLPRQLPMVRSTMQIRAR